MTEFDPFEAIVDDLDLDDDRRVRAIGAHVASFGVRPRVSLSEMLPWRGRYLHLSPPLQQSTGWFMPWVPDGGIRISTTTTFDFGRWLRWRCTFKFDDPNLLTTLRTSSSSWLLSGTYQNVRKTKLAWLTSRLTGRLPPPTLTIDETTFYSIKDAAARLGISREALDNWIKAGKIGTVKPAWRVGVEPDDVDRSLDEQFRKWVSDFANTVRANTALGRQTLTIDDFASDWWPGWVERRPLTWFDSMLPAGFSPAGESGPSDFMLGLLSRKGGWLHAHVAYNFTKLTVQNGIYNFDEDAKQYVCELSVRTVPKDRGRDNRDLRQETDETLQKEIAAISKWPILGGRQFAPAEKDYTEIRTQPHGDRRWIRAAPASGDGPVRAPRGAAMRTRLAVPIQVIPPTPPLNTPRLPPLALVEPLWSWTPG